MHYLPNQKEHTPSMKHAKLFELLGAQSLCLPACREVVDLSEIHVSNLINNDISHRLSFGQLCMGKNAILTDRRRRGNKDLFGRG